ncbi:MAG TPA: hypothetical protein VL970_00240 [Candidatus Acidoferrales bacterium]|nr:hypothetical protein [Candidatus Acidoferrales bacterium]
MNRLNSLTDREKRTIRLAGIGLAIYLALFGGFEAWKYLDQERSDYRQLTQEARDLREEALRYQNKVRVVTKLMEEFHLDPARLKRQTVVADASAAIQQAARASGVGIGTLRETPARGSGKTLASVQLECSGPVSGAMSFLTGLKTIGFPLLVDSVQFTSFNQPPGLNQPGMIKMNLTIIILDFDQQKETSEETHA